MRSAAPGRRQFRACARGPDGGLVESRLGGRAKITPGASDSSFLGSLGRATEALRRWGARPNRLPPYLNLRLELRGGGVHWTDSEICRLSSFKVDCRIKPTEMRY